MVAHPTESHLRNEIFLRSTCFVRMLRNPFEMRVFVSCFSIVLPADVIRSEKKIHIIAVSFVKERLIITDDIINAILFVDRI